MIFLIFFNFKEGAICEEAWKHLFVNTFNSCEIANF